MSLVDGSGGAMSAADVLAIVGGPFATPSEIVVAVNPVKPRAFHVPSTLLAAGVVWSWIPTYAGTISGLMAQGAGAITVAPGLRLQVNGVDVTGSALTLTGALQNKAVSKPFQAGDLVALVMTGSAVGVSYVAGNVLVS